jgi:hypothetical protein
MSPGEAIRAVLIADPTVAGLVGARIYPSLMPQGPTLPAIVYQVISEVPESSLAGTSVGRLTASRLQIDCYATTYLAAHALADAVDVVISALSSPDLSAWRESSRDLYDNEAQLHRCSLDFAVWR